MKIFLYNKKKEYDIMIDISRFLYKDDKHDLVFIEIKPQDNIECTYLELDYNLNNKKEYNNKYHNKLVYILQYPYGGQSQVSFGKLKVISMQKNEYYIWHTCSTDNGSSGSPILLLEDLKVIGIHLRRQNNRSIINEGNFLFDINNLIEKNYLKFIIEQNREKSYEQLFIEGEKNITKSENINFINRTEKNNSKEINYYKKQSSTSDSSFSQNFKYNINIKGKRLFDDNFNQFNNVIDFDNNNYINDHKLEKRKDDYFLTDLSNIDSNNLHIDDKFCKVSDYFNDLISNEGEIEKNDNFSESDFNNIAESVIEYRNNNLSKVSNIKKDCVFSILDNQRENLNPQKNKYNIIKHNNTNNYQLASYKYNKSYNYKKTLSKVSILDYPIKNPSNISSRNSFKNNICIKKKNCSNSKIIKSNKEINTKQQLKNKNSNSNIPNRNQVHKKFQIKFDKDKYYFNKHQ